MSDFIEGIVGTVGPAKKTTLTNVYIDAANGNDGYIGSSGFPWKTNARLQKEIGLYGLVSPTGLLLTIHYVGTAAPPISDPFNWFAIHDTDVVVLRNFAGISGQTIHTGTLSGVRTISHVAPGTSAAITDASMPNWSAYIGKRVRFTSGAANGAVCVILLNETATRAEVSPPCVLTLAPEPDSVITYPAPGDTYVVETLPNDYQGAIDIKVKGTGVADPFLVHANSTIVTTPSASHNSSKTSMAMCIICYIGCIFPLEEDIFQTVAPHRTYLACGFLNGIFNEGSQQMILYSCGIIGSVCAVTFQGTIVVLGDTIAEGFGFVAQDGGRILIEGAAAAFNTAPSFFNPSGDGFCSHASIPQTDGHIEQRVPSGAVYGSGNAGVGWRVGRGATDTSAVRPVVTGTGGDFALDTSTTAFAFNTSTGTYTAPAITCSWANMNDATKLNGQAHWPPTNSHLLTVAGS